MKHFEPAAQRGKRTAKAEFPVAANVWAAINREGKGEGSLVQIDYHRDLDLGELEKKFISLLDRPLGRAVLRDGEVTH